MRIRERQYRKIISEITFCLVKYEKHPKLKIILTELVRKLNRIST